MHHSESVDQRLEQAPVVTKFGRAVRPVAGVVAFYAGGSLASNDFRPGISDLDLVAIIDRELDEDRQVELQELHERTRRNDAAAASLHCVYVPQDQVSDVSAPHLTWAHGELYPRLLSGIARAELLRGGITLWGPSPAELLPPVDRAALRAAARSELTGYWSGAVRKPWLWLEDVYVDLGLLTLARVEAVLTEDRLITKNEALGRLHRFGVPPELVTQIARRRQGQDTPLTRPQRLRRATRARHICAAGIRELIPQPRGHRSHGSRTS